VKSSTPVFQQSAANGVYGTGGNDFFKSPDGSEDWFVYHATSNPNGDCGNGRSSRIQKITWNANGTPNFGVPVSTATDVPIPAAPIIIPNGTYRITHAITGRVLDAMGCSGNNGTLPEIWDWYGADCQRWQFEHMGDGWYKITCRLGGRALDNASCLPNDGNKIQLYDWLDNDCQRWRIQGVWDRARGRRERLWRAFPRLRVHLPGCILAANNAGPPRNVGDQPTFLCVGDTPHPSSQKRAGGTR